jgi:hypothetical protein
MVFSLFLAEGEGEGLHSGIEKFNFESSVFDRAFLADELIEAMTWNGASACGVGVAAVVIAGGGAVECDFEADGLAIFRGAQNQVQIARVEAEDNFAGGCFENGAFGADFPTAA